LTLVWEIKCTCTRSVESEFWQGRIDERQECISRYTLKGRYLLVMLLQSGFPEIKYDQKIFQFQYLGFVGLVEQESTGVLFIFCFTRGTFSFSLSLSHILVRDPVAQQAIATISIGAFVKQNEGVRVDLYSRIEELTSFHRRASCSFRTMILDTKN
jgi:hypothetical protein